MKPTKVQVGAALLGTSLLIGIPAYLDIKHLETRAVPNERKTLVSLEATVIAEALTEELGKENTYRLKVANETQDCTLHVQSSYTMSNKGLSEILEPGMEILIGPIVIPRESPCKIYVSAHNIAPTKPLNDTEMGKENTEQGSTPQRYWWGRYSYEG